MKYSHQERNQAKAELKEALSKYGGNTKNEVVVAAIDKLISLNPTSEPARTETLMDGDWLLINAPNFPGGEQLEDGKLAYTLGRLAFNMFQPAALKLVIEQVSQPVFPVGNGEQRSHDIVVTFRSIETKFSNIRGIVRNLGVCNPINSHFLQVKFTGGILEPAPDTDLQTWKAIFREANQPKQRNWLDQLKLILPKIMFGILPPQGMDEQTGKIVFSMNRSPVGKLEILYLDENLRITKGERGTVLVCEKL